METSGPHSAAHSLRTALIASGGAALGLGVVATCLLALAGADSPIAWPAVTLVGGGQLFALLAALSSAVAWWRSSTTGVATLARVARHLAFLQRAVLVWAVVGAAGWVLYRPELGIAVLLIAAVTAQLALVLGLLHRRMVPELPRQPR